MKQANRIFGVVLVTAMTALNAGSVAVISERSELVAVFKQMNVPVDGRFTRFNGSVVFDADRPSEAEAELLIDTTSFDLGMADFNAEVAKAEWLDSGNHPEARFTARGLQALGEGRYRATGTLNLKGRRAVLSTELTVTHQDGLRIFAGEVPFSRTAFAVGDKGWDGVVDDTVVVRFRIVQDIP